MSVGSGVLGLLGLARVFYAEMKDKVIAYVRDVPDNKDDVGKGAKPGVIYKTISNAFIRATSIPRGSLLRRQLRSTVIRRGNHADSERICTGPGSVRDGIEGTRS